MTTEVIEVLRLIHT